MSKSLRRVTSILERAGTRATVLEMDGQTRTAAEAAKEASCEIDQIAKSIVCKGALSQRVVLFITAGGNRVQSEAAEQVASEALERADPEFVRRLTGFAIGGVAPIGHLNEPLAFFDPRLLDFELVYAAAGTPKHIFSIDPRHLLELSAAQLSDFT